MKRPAWMVLMAVAVLGLALAGGPRMGGARQAGEMGGPQVGMAAGLVRALHDDVATVLGLAPEELLALRQQGKTLAQIAQERGVDLANLEAKLVQARNAAIDEALKNGSLSEIQAARMKARTQVAVQAMLQREAGPAVGSAHAKGAGPAAAPREPTWPHSPRGGASGPFGPARNR
jgi:hypothetical protein